MRQGYANQEAAETPLVSLLLQGLASQREDRLDEAAQCYADVLARDPRHADALHLTGVLALRRDDPHAAVRWIGRAVRENGGVALYHQNLAAALCAQGRRSEAMARYRTALALSPADTNSLLPLAELLAQAGDEEAALPLFREVVRLAPERAEAYGWLGSLLKKRGDPDGAITVFAEAVERFPEMWEAHLNLGGALFEARRLADCLLPYEAVQRLRPDFADAHNCVGRVLHELNDLDGARVEYLKAIGLDERHADALSNLGALLMDQGELKSAEIMLKQALQVSPDMLNALSNLGTVYSRCGQVQGAVECFHKVLTRDPKHLAALCSLGFLHDALGDEEGSIGFYALALEVDPQSDVARFNLSTHLLAHGDFGRGWREYERRWKVRQFYSKRRQLAQPQWRGEDLKGARILLYSEQGFGDTIQFARYVPIVAALGAEVILEVQPGVYNLLREAEGATQVVSGVPLAASEFDWQCPLLSVPLALGTELATIPAKVPYIHARGEDVASWSTRMQGHGMKVGIVWSGNPEHTRDTLRSVPLTEFQGVLGVEGVQFFSLQKGPGVVQLERIPAAIRPVDLDPHLLDFTDTAAAIAHLDLVICVDTSVAHLAGAMGKPVWILLHHASDWRWLRDRGDSPWYPTAKLFRLTKEGSWDEVLQQIAAELQTLAGGRKLDGTAQSTLPGCVACKVCGVSSPLYGVVDANKSCIEAQGRRLPLSGRAVYYRQCEGCGFVFTTDFDAWDHDAFHRHIYNDDYLQVDPDFVELRPTNNAKLITTAFGVAKEKIRVLDYGGGSGLLAAKLRDQGFDATTYDPFSDHNVPPEGKFDLITCFEVMEHVPFPQETVETICGLLQEGGAILFSTLVQPANFVEIGLNWWYAGPRNGHVSLYSSKALGLIFARHGLKVGSFNEGFHIAYATVPDFAAHLTLPG